MDSTSGGNPAEGSPSTSHTNVVKQWASRVVSFSSEYTTNSWGSIQILGKPKVYPSYGDNGGAWTPKPHNVPAFIEVEFDHVVWLSSIHIYETLNPGAVVKVKGRESTGAWTLLWETNSPVKLANSRIFSPQLSESDKNMMRINQLRIELDMSAAGYYAELDAVQLVGYSNIRVVPIDDTSFVGDMSSLVNSNLYSDFTLNTTGGSIPVHKAILAARSPYFAKMFKNSNNTTVTFNDTQFKFHDLKIALHFLYTNRLPIGITWSGLAAMSKASSLLEVPDLKSAAICTLKDRMKVDNVVCVFKVMQDDTALDDLKTICLTFMASKLKDMAKEPSFETLSQKVIISVIQEATTSVDINKE